MVQLYCLWKKDPMPVGVCYIYVVLGNTANQKFHLHFWDCSHFHVLQTKYPRCCLSYTPQHGDWWFWKNFPIKPNIHGVLSLFILKLHTKSESHDPQDMPDKNMTAKITRKRNWDFFGRRSNHKINATNITSPCQFQ